MRAPALRAHRRACGEPRRARQRAAAAVLPGLGGCWQNRLENLPELARDHRVIALDLPGFGASQMPVGEISVAGYARTLDAVCAALSIDAAAVVGNSMGGFVAAELALAQPRRVERLVLVSAAGLHIGELRLDRAGPAGRAERALARTGGFVAGRSVAIARTGGFVAGRSVAFARRARLRRLVLAGVVAHSGASALAARGRAGRRCQATGLHAGAAGDGELSLRDRLAQIACPTLIVWGARARVVPVRDAAVFERLIPDTRKILYPGTGHVPMLERPQRFNADLRAFLGDAPGAAA